MKFSKLSIFFYCTVDLSLFFAKQTQSLCLQNNVVSARSLNKDKGGQYNYSTWTCNWFLQYKCVRFYPKQREYWLVCVQ